MSEFVISTRYANALMELSEEKGTFEKSVADISLIKNTLDSSKELRHFLISPVIASDKKSAALEEIFNSHVGTDVNKFLSFLVEKGRENFLLDICERFISLSNEKLNQVNVNITSAIELSNAQKDDIKANLEVMINKKIVAEYVVDGKIIGGFKARFNDTVIDASVQHQLELLKKKLFEEDYLKN